MKELKEKLQELAEKQTWVRKAFQDFLDKWAESTKDFPNDTSIEYLVLYEDDDEYLYIIEAGCADLSKIDREAYYYDDFSRKMVVDICTCDMFLLRNIIRRLPRKIEEYVEKISVISKDLDDLYKALKGYHAA